MGPGARAVLMSPPARERMGKQLTLFALPDAHDDMTPCEHASAFFVPSGPCCPARQVSHVVSPRLLCALGNCPGSARSLLWISDSISACVLQLEHRRRWLQAY